MSTYLRFILVVFLIVFTQNIYSQDVSIPAESMDPNNNSEVLEPQRKTPEQMLREAVEMKLRKSNKHLGNINDDGTIFMIAAATCTYGPNNSSHMQFINSRNIAFEKAVMTAKLEIIKTVEGVVLSTEKEFNITENTFDGADPQMKEKASMLNKMKRLADKSIDNALEAAGIDPMEIASMNQEAKELALSDRFKKITQQFSGGMIKGISIMKTVEGLYKKAGDDYQVAVCVKFDPKQCKASTKPNLLGASSKQMNCKSINQLRNMAPEKLVGKLGAQFFNDGDGGLVVVGFGQQGLYDRMQSTRAMRSARQKAKLMCQASIKDLVSENLLGEEMRDQNEGFFQTSDGEVTRFNADKWQSNIKSTASSLKINPLSIRSWEAKHPITGKTLVGEIMILAETKNID